MDTYLAIEREVIRRRRWLNALRGLRWGATVSLAITLVYIGAVSLGWPERVPWSLLVLLNLVSLLYGARLGYRRSVALQEDLYRVDRAFGLGEKLTTIYELRRAGGAEDFLEALYRKTQDLSLDPARALPVPRSERRAWLLLGVLGVATLAASLLWLSGVPPLPLAGLPFGSAMTSARPDPSNPAPRETTTSGSESEAQEQAAGQKSGRASPAAALAEALRELQGGLKSGELTPEQVHAQLARLSEQVPSSELERLLAPSGREELQRALEEARQQLERALSGGADPQSAEPEDRSGPGSSSSTEEAANPPQGGSAPSGKDEAQAQPSDQANASSSGQAEGEQNNSSASGESSGGENSSEGGAEAASAGEPSEGKPTGDDLRQSSSPSSGSGVGEEPGSKTAASGKQPLPTQTELPIHSALLPKDAQVLARLLTQGIPVDLIGQQPDGTPILRVSLPQVEALLELRSLPPELRALVRAYFLAIGSEE